MRDMSHRAAAAITLGLLTDDLFGALMDAPSGAATTPSQERKDFSDYLAASRWLRDDGSVRRDPKARAAILRLN